MEYYCSSPNCRNECGKKEDKKKYYLKCWQDPQYCEGKLMCYEKFCDDDGNKLEIFEVIQ